MEVLMTCLKAQFLNTYRLCAFLGGLNVLVLFTVFIYFLYLFYNKKDMEI